MDYYAKPTIETLQNKGGAMLFTVERKSQLYRGIVLLYPVGSGYQYKRITCMRVYDKSIRGLT
jgi:hypothetical protein